MKKLYRIWLPQVSIHGDCFDKICEKCQRKIGRTIGDKLVLPTNPALIIHDEVTITFGYTDYGSLSGKEVTFCPNCTNTFKEWLDKNELHISNESIELWVSNLEDFEKVGIKSS